MTKRGKYHLAKPLVIVLAMVSLSGCVSPVADSVGRYTAPIGNAPVIPNETPYSAALRCLSRFTAAHPIRIAVGQIADYTGKLESDNSGRKLTQGAALMAMSALAKAGVPLVERFDTSVAEMELKYANNKLIGDGGPPVPGDYRKIMAGSIPGSDYYIVGGITELNFNIRSVGADADGGGTATNSLTGTAGASLYVMNVGLDLRMVDTNTLQVVDVVSYQKQIIGRQEQAGVFNFLGHTFFDASLGESALEPVQLAVRSVIERAMLEMITRLYHTPMSACSSDFGSSKDPLSGPDDASPYNHVQLNTANATNPVPRENHNDAPHQNPYRFYSSADPADEPGLRGRIE
ncbi:MAG: holdfast anchoring protein HfaB [Rhizomicrobium sp.]|jgi:curli production assembly/transport component CsgG/holdfast attachment protein HfaB